MLHAVSDRYVAELAVEPDALPLVGIDQRELSARWRPLSYRRAESSRSNRIANWIVAVRNFENQQGKDVKAKQHYCPLKQDHPKTDWDVVGGQ